MSFFCECVWKVDSAPFHEKLNWEQDNVCMWKSKYQTHFSGALTRHWRWIGRNNAD
jgi:hypothetical protein